MVGAAEGLGGRLIRTVSFLGWTLPVSFFGGTAPVGMLGMFSAINCILLKIKVAAPRCQTLIPTDKSNLGPIHDGGSMGRGRPRPCNPSNPGNSVGPRPWLPQAVSAAFYPWRRQLQADYRLFYARSSVAPCRALFQRGARSSRGRAIFTVRA